MRNPNYKSVIIPAALLERLDIERHIGQSWGGYFEELFTDYQKLKADIELKPIVLTPPTEFPALPEATQEPGSMYDDDREDGEPEKHSKVHINSTYRNSDIVDIDISVERCDIKWKSGETDIYYSKKYLQRRGQ